MRRLTAYIERINRDTVLLPYVLGEESKLKKKVYFQRAWVEMIQDQTVTILGWIQYEKVKWLQNNNPEVPSLVYKLAPMDEKMRKLNNVRKLWAGRELYRKGNSEEEFYNILQKNMQPVYDSARRQGYEVWNRG